MKILFKIGAAMAAIVSASASASVSVTSNAGLLSGSVGNGGIMATFNLKPAQMQKYTNSVSFGFSDHVSVTYTCNALSGPTTYMQDFDRTADLVTTYGTGSAGQGAGWSFSGPLTAGSNIPALGDPCPSDGSAQVTSVTSSESAASLTVTIPGLGTHWLQISNTNGL